MARKKGMGNLQRERDGRWTLRVCIRGKRISRSTGTDDRAAAEAYLERFLAPLGRGRERLKLADVWHEYERSPNRRDLAPSTLTSKRIVWMHFARWIEHQHLEITELKHITSGVIAEYLSDLKVDHTASTYNSRVCVLREMFRVLSEKAGLFDDPWAGVCLRNDDSHSRRELSKDEVDRLFVSAAKQGTDYRRLFAVGIFTGLRLGDCCRLSWSEINLNEGVIQVIPEKTKKYANKRPVTIPIHAQLAEVLSETPEKERKGYVIPALAEDYNTRMWRLSGAMKKIFESAGVKMSVKIEGRSRLTPEATFHSLRHTFVSISANAGVPLHVVQSIVGHESTAMTRHYYHENIDALRRAVSAIPSFGSDTAAPSTIRPYAILAAKPPPASAEPVEVRLRKLARLAKKGLVSPDEFNAHRARILSEL